MREVASWMVQGFLGNSAITALVGKDVNNNPAIFSDQGRLDSQYAPYPHITVTRIRSVKSLAMFDEQPDTAGQFDCPIMAVSTWAKDTKDSAYQIYVLVEQMLLGTSAMKFANQYFSGYKIVRRDFRDNLFDERAQAYHVYGEFSMWAQLTTVAQPF